jgi:hypothetical protein
MSEYEEIAKNIPLKESSTVLRGNDIFYRCDFCQTVIPSLPAEKVFSCACGRLDVDTIMLRLGYDENNLTVLRQIR